MTHGGDGSHSSHVHITKGHFTQVIDRLKESLAAGSAYEGLQSVKAANRRLRTRGQLSSGYSLLGEAASLLWMAGQLSGSLDLAKTLLQACSLMRADRLLFFCEGHASSELDCVKYGSRNQQDSPIYAALEVSAQHPPVD